MSFAYSSNQQLKAAYKELAKSKNITMREVARRLGLSTPQQLNNKFNNKRISFDDMQKFLDVIGCSLEISFKDK